MRFSVKNPIRTKIIVLFGPGTRKPFIEQTQNRATSIAFVITSIEVMTKYVEFIVNSIEV
jgi:hypothetical protein